MVMSSFRSGGPPSPNWLGILPSTCHSQLVRYPFHRPDPNSPQRQPHNMHTNLPGRFSCVGKQLGLMEVRRVTVMIARKFDVAMALGQTKEAFLGGLRDNFTLATPALNLVFSPRS